MFIKQTRRPRQSGGYIQTQEMEPDTLFTTRRGPLLPLMASMPGEAARVCPVAEMAGENQEALLMPGWRPAMFPGARRPRQTQKGSFTHRAQRTRMDVGLPDPSDKQLSTDASPLATTDQGPHRNPQVRWG